MEGLLVMVVDEDIYRRPPSLLIATVDKLRRCLESETQNLFGQLNGLCLRHGFSPERGRVTSCRQNPPRHEGIAHNLFPFVPPDLIIQDVAHLTRPASASMVAPWGNGCR